MHFHSISKPFGLAVLLPQVVLLVPLWTTTAIGQTALTNSTASRVAAASEATGTAPATYRSAFEDYQPYTDEKLINWREANDNAGRIGGWRAYAKETELPAQAPQRPGVLPINSPAPKTDPHAGHGKP